MMAALAGALDRKGRLQHSVQRRAALIQWRKQVALMDYQKLCPRSGHFLTHDECEAVRASARNAGEPLTIKCETCGRTVEVCLDSGKGRKMIYPMHVREVDDLQLGRGSDSK
jgi:hypothetical protein